MNLIGKDNNLDKNVIFITGQLAILWIYFYFFLCLWQRLFCISFYIAALAQLTCLCSKKATVQLSLGAILSTFPLTCGFPLSPSWIQSTGRSGILWLSSLKWWTEMPLQALKLYIGLHNFLWVSPVYCFKGGGYLFCIMCVHQALFLLSFCMSKLWHWPTIWSKAATFQVRLYLSVYSQDCQLFF